VIVAPPLLVGASKYKLIEWFDVEIDEMRGAFAVVRGVADVAAEA